MAEKPRWKIKIEGEFILTLDETGTIVDRTPRQVVECWSRVMGYHRPISQFNIGKKQEFQDRKMFEEPK